MNTERHILDEDDNAILDSAKESIEKAIELLLKRNVRRTNIEIELLMHIRKSLKHE